jgi:hypothetical protein
MTEPDAPPAAESPPTALEQLIEGPPPQTSLPRAARDPLPWLFGVGFLVLAGAIGFVWWSSQQAQPQPSAALQALEDRIARLEQRPAPQQQMADLGPLTARVAALEQRAPPDLAPLEARVAALEKQTADNSRFTAKLDALSGRMDALSGHDRSVDADLAHRLDTDEARLVALEHATAQMTAVADRAALRTRIQAAETALAAGQPVGDLPGAPAAVARFAATNPPTEASLRLTFPAASRAAQAASRPDADEKPFLARVLTQAEDLVTVRQGDRVLVGDPAAGVLARARTALDAGDLAGAVAAVSDLSGPPAAAMAAWLADAKALLRARAGLADMAAHA